MVTQVQNNTCCIAPQNAHALEATHPPLVMFKLTENVFRVVNRLVFGRLEASELHSNI